MNEQFIVKLAVGRKTGETRTFLVLYDFASFLGGERSTFDYECFCKCKELSSDPVDLWQIVPAHFDGVNRLVMLVDEEGLVRNPQDPMNIAATISAGIGYSIYGDVFLCHRQNEDLQFLSWSDVVSIYDNFALVPPSPVKVI